MVDFFLVLMLHGAGDELQGIKKGILELADMVAINKADGENAQKAAVAAKEYEMALHLMAPTSDLWAAPVVTCAGLTGEGVSELWDKIINHKNIFSKAGATTLRREEQRVRWMWAMLDDRLVDALRSHERVRELLPILEAQVRAEQTTPVAAVDHLISAFLEI